MKRILLLIESLRINETSSGIVSSTFVKLVYSLGYQIKIITPNTFKYKVNWLPENIDKTIFNLPDHKKCLLDGIPKLRAFPTYLTGFNSDFRALINKWKSIIYHELEIKKYDFIYVLGSGSEFAPHFAISEMNIGTPFILNFHDPFPMYLYPAPYKKERNRINKLLEKKIRLAISKAYKISFPSQMLMELMTEAFPLAKGKSFVIPHIGTELSNLPENENDKLIDLDTTKINILHVGSLLGPRNPQFLIQSIIDLNKTIPDLLKNVRFVFVGKIARELKHLAKTEIDDCIQFFDFRVSYRKSIELIRKSAGTLVIEAISDFSPFMPGKLADIAFLEKPVIALSPRNSEIMRLLGYDYPYWAELDNKKMITNAIVSFLSDFESANVNIQQIKRIKEYISIERNGMILKSILE